MTSRNRSALLALAAAGALWGLTVPLSKLALAWMGPGWLAVARFAVAAPLLGVIGRRRLREALSLRVAAAGGVGFGAVIVLQNIGIEHTSVSHAALVVGAVPVLVALIGIGLGGPIARPLAWGGYLIALVGIGLTAGSGGSGASTSGDLLVLASAALSAAVIAVQPRLLAGRDPAAVTAVQFAAGSLVALPVALISQGGPPAPIHVAPVVAFAALAGVGTLLPFWLFAFGQSRVSAELAGAFVNLEPIVGVSVGWLAFGNAAAVMQILGAAAVLGGIALSAAAPEPAPRPVRATQRRRRGAAGEHHPAQAPRCRDAEAATGGSSPRFPPSAPGRRRDLRPRRAARGAGAAGPRGGRARPGSPPGAGRPASVSGLQRPHGF